jgi:hypothetical protein
MIASAVIDGKEVKKKPLDFGEIKLAERPKLLIHVLPAGGSTNPAFDAAWKRKTAEISLAPGQTIPVVVRLERNGFEGEVKFGTEFAGRNLPHGCYIDNIGLNGLTVLKGETERTFFITARKWVPEQSRLFHLRAAEEGNQVSGPVMLHIRNRPTLPVPETDKTLAASPDAK